MKDVTRKLVSTCLVSAFVSSFMYASTIDQKSVKVEYIGYKTPYMAELAGNFKNIKYTFGRDNKTIKGVLSGASALIVPTSSIIEDNEEATNNMNKVFFPTLLGKNNIQVVFVDVVEGDNKGLISAKIIIGKQSCIIPLEYEIEKNTLIAKGRLDLNNFSNSAKALKALSDAAAGHAGITWANVDIVFTANIVD